MLVDTAEVRPCHNLVEAFSVVLQVMVEDIEVVEVATRSVTLGAVKSPVVKFQLSKMFPDFYLLSFDEFIFLQNHSGYQISF